MKNKIPIDLLKKYIRDSGWTPDYEHLNINFQPKVNINDLINGKTFEGNDIVSSLNAALDFACPKGYIATMPELISAKVQVEKNHILWDNVYNVQSEELVGIDRKGKIYPIDEKVLVFIHGASFLTHYMGKDSDDEYNGSLLRGGVNYLSQNFDKLLNGTMPDGSSIELYNYDSISKGVSNLPHRFGVVVPISVVKNSEHDSSYDKKDFLENESVISRNGGRKNLEEYYNKAKDANNIMKFVESLGINIGRLYSGLFLTLDADSGGMGFYGIPSESRFLVVGSDSKGVDYK